MIYKVSVKIADILESKGLVESSRRGFCEYGLRQIMYTLLNAGTMLLIGLLMKMPLEAVLFAVTYIPLRVYVGGFHASTPLKCWAVSAVMLIAVLIEMKYLYTQFHYLFFALSLIACIFIIILSPVEDTNKPLDSTEKRVYHIRTMYIIAVQGVVMLVLFFIKAEQAVSAIQSTWITLFIMVILGILKNKVKSKREKRGS